tara:strand:+ start:799 stop:1152 length:354 start_codon:yes stop_codon:yes gene_type:complete
MYLPITGYKKKDNLEAKMKVSSTNTAQAAAPAGRPRQVAEDNNKVQEQKAQQNNQTEQNSVDSEKFKSHGSKPGMSTEDFLSIHNSSVENMADSIKDAMALKVLEKTLEVIDKIVSN